MMGWEVAISYKKGLIYFSPLKYLASRAYMTDKYEKLNGSYNPILLELKQKSFDDFFKK